MTWLYVPALSATSHCAPGEEDSTWDLNSRCETLALACTWRGKLSPSRTWSQRCNRVSWLRALCGAMPEPSTAAHGAALWMASLAASRASRGAELANDGARTMSAICGRPRGGSSSNRESGSSLSRTCPAWLTKGAPSEFGETFSDLVLRWRADCSARLRRAQRSGAIGFSFWQSPTTRDAKGQSGRGNRIKRGNGDRLHVANLQGYAMQHLGLAGSAHVVAFAHVAANKPDGGARFTVMLPDAALGSAESLA